MKLVVVTAIILLMLINEQDHRGKSDVKLFNLIQNRLIRGLSANFSDTIRSPYKTETNDFSIFGGITFRLFSSLT